MSKTSLEDELLDLAALSLDENERRRFAEKLGRVISYIDQLRSIDDRLLAVEDSSTGCPPAKLDSLREDEVVPGSISEEALAQAPWTDGSYFLAPPLLRSEDGP